MDAVADAELRQRIEDGLKRAIAAADPSQEPEVPESDEAPGLAASERHRYVSFYVAGARGPIIVAATFLLRGDMVLVTSFAFDDEGGSLGRPQPPAL